SAGSVAAVGAATSSTLPLRIGGNAIWPEYFQGLIDEVRVYSKALSASEIQTDMATPIGSPLPSDTQAPTAPSNLKVGTPAQTSLPLSWNASTDNVGVTGYDVYNGTAKVGTTQATSFTVSGLSC